MLFSMVGFMFGNPRAIWLRIFWATIVLSTVGFIVLGAFNVNVPRWVNYAVVAFALIALIVSRVRREQRLPNHISENVSGENIG